MKLSTKGRYGLKAMFDLALFASDKPISLSTISMRQGISVNYLEQLIAPLRRAGLVKSVRGAQGGYILNKSPKEITVKEILVILEGPFAPADCVQDDNDDCMHANYCVTKLIYEKMKESIDIVTESITLENMIEDYERIIGSKRDDDEVFKCF